ncbi:tumor necrosis factor receptor superfamily member 5-like isoform X2 [Halichoeres trimaculatus]
MLTPLLFPLLFLSLRSSLVDGVPEPLLTFKDTDPISGKPLTCDRCPPGTYLRARCTEHKKSACAPCPQGSFTELWNYIGKCLRCSACAHNQVVKAACTAQSDCQCACRSGFYYDQRYDTCVPHSECPSGQEVLSAGTADQDTVCRTCPNGTFSDVVSAQKNCSQHRSCQAAGLELLLRGSAWHDNVCMSCSTSTDGALYLKDIFPSFLVHHRPGVRKLRHVLRHVLREDGKKLEGLSSLGVSELHQRITAWVASASAEQIRQLPAAFTRAGASGAAERLQSKLSRMESQAYDLCGLNNAVDAL